jgi:hypothetical protein
MSPRVSFQYSDQAVPSRPPPEGRPSSMSFAGVKILSFQRSKRKRFSLVMLLIYLSCGQFWALHFLGCLVK